MRKIIIILTLAVLVTGPLSAPVLKAADVTSSPTAITADNELRIDGIDWDEWLESISLTWDEFMRIDGIDWDEWLEGWFAPDDGGTVT